MGEGDPLEIYLARQTMQRSTNESDQGHVFMLTKIFNEAMKMNAYLRM